MALPFLLIWKKGGGHKIADRDTSYRPDQWPTTGALISLFSLYIQIPFSTRATLYGFYMVLFRRLNVADNKKSATCMMLILHSTYSLSEYESPEIGRANICLTCTTSDAPTYSGVCDMLICRYNVVSTPILAILQYGPFSGCYNSVRLSRQLWRVPTSI